MRDDVFFQGIPEMARLLRGGKTTSVELTRFALARLEKYGPMLNCVAHLTTERAEAAHADAEIKAGRYRGPLHGIPYGAKDLYAAKGYPTEWGSYAHKGQTFEEDAVAIHRLKEAGAVLVAKLAMVSLAGGGGYSYADTSSTGPCRNPWDRDRWTGGSSSGSGAAVGAGLVPFALGSETWGSIVCPSSFCGVTGLRPTYGRVPRTGAMALSWTMDKLGPLARTAEDAGLVLAAIAGPDASDPTSVVGPYRHASRGRRKLTVGVVPETWKGGDPKLHAHYEQALKDLEKTGATLKDIKLPYEPYGFIGGMMISCEGVSSFENVVRGPRLAKLNRVEQRAGFASNLVYGASDYLHAMRLRRKCQLAVAGVFEHVDALVAPSYTIEAPPAEGNMDKFWAGDGMLQAAGNCVGIPCISVPLGFGTHGLPGGLQICANAGDERTAVTLATAYQRVTDWHRHHPKGYA